ncbi:hypothetical protein I3842_09G127600 [Carya illinoinensis]|uniref:Uncharacterized protein n=1 Tax=Carya illinoinensis TaxID=32201 RepID=A0A922J7A3_CARIL|nr:hypothetical protein I3842_09G127600 [Carya illinoinensis]
MANNGYKDEDPAIFIRSDSKQKHTSTGGNMKELKPITESIPKGQEGTEVKAATELKSQLKDEEHREAKAILESLRKGRESRELKATLELLRKFQAGMELMVIRKSPHKDFQHIDTKMFSEELRKVLDGQDRLDEMIIELETKFGLHGNRSDDSHLGEPDGTERKEKDGEDPVVIVSSAEDRATDDQGKLEAGDDDAKEQFHGEKSKDDPDNLSEYVLVDFCPDLRECQIYV